VSRGPGDRLVDGRGRFGGGGEVRVAQGDGERPLLNHLHLDFLLHDGAIGDPPGGRVVLGDPLAAAPACGVEPADGDRALGDGIDITVRALQGRLDELPALQALGVADR